MRISASAPGKVVIAGEYAVLDGAPAISMAVDRRARVSVQRAGGKASTVTAPGYKTGTQRFRIERGRFTWLDNSTAVAVVEEVWRAGGLSRLAPVDISLDTRAFAAANNERKLGIGSSAAVTVALTAAIGAFAAEARNTGRVALAAHRALQDGRGSGIDVATALAGGVVEYRMNALPARPVTWPDGLKFAFVWSGKAASTAERLRHLAGAEPRASRKHLVRAAEHVAGTWADASAEAVLDVLGAYAQVLRRFGIDHGLGIFEAGHEQLFDAAPEGVVYKPCGAGGGDIGIALALDESVLEDFVRLAGQHGFTHLPLAIDHRGVESEGGSD